MKVTKLPKETIEWRSTILKSEKGIKSFFTFVNWWKEYGNKPPIVDYFSIRLYSGLGKIGLELAIFNFSISFGIRKVK